MEILPAKKKPLLTAPPFIPDELISEILSALNVEYIIRFKCVSKSWNTLISDPIFVEKHFKKSSQNPHLILTPPISKYPISSVKSFSVNNLLENPPITVSGDSYNDSDQSCHVVGSCNGLICFIYHSLYKKYARYWFCLWNPATRTISEELGSFRCYNNISEPFKFSFGFDLSNGTYKVVAYRAIGEDVTYDSWRSQVRIFSLSDNCWRNIESFPLIPIECIQIMNRNNNCVYLNGNVNWLVIQNFFCSYYHRDCISSVDQFVIASLDLSTETYTQFSLPPGFIEVPQSQPTLHVLMDCLCFSHDFKGTEFVIWKMKDFRVQESWTQLFIISYFNLQMYKIPIDYTMDFFETIEECGTPFLPLFVSKNGDTVILANYEDDRAIIYNWRDKRVERIRISNKLCWFTAMDYVESLISTPWKSATRTRRKLSVDGSVV